MSGPSAYDDAVEELEAGYFSVCLPELDESGEPFIRHVILREPTIEAIEGMYHPDEDYRVALALGFMVQARHETGCPTPPHTSNYAPEEDY